MVKYWLRSNNIDNYQLQGEYFTLWAGRQSNQFRVGDQLVMYVFNPETKEKYLTGVFEVIDHLKVKSVLALPREKWIERPPIEEWEALLQISLKANVPELYAVPKHAWVGRVASEGLLLEKEDFDALKKLIEEADRTQ